MTGRSPEIPMEILLVDDDPGDVTLTREVLTEGKLYNNVHVVDDGQAAIAFLRREPPYDHMLRPDLVLLDLNMPRKDGREALAEIKADPDLRRIPVVILTTSGAEEDILRSYNLHANAYVQKPIDLDRFMQVVQSIDDFFLTVVRLPPR